MVSRNGMVSNSYKPSDCGFSVGNGEGFKPRLILFDGEDLDTQAFFDRTGVFYCSHLDFENYDIFREASAAYPSYLCDGQIALQAEWNGKFYRHEILSGYCAPVSIRWISKKVGYGLFAEVALPANHYVAEYTGVVRRRKRLLPDFNGYCFDYPSRPWPHKAYLVDSLKYGNETRYINHSDNPNLEILYAKYKDVVHIVFRTYDVIPAGTQLTFDYGKAYWKVRTKLSGNLLEGKCNA